jgi:hypothetical protein
MDKIIEASNNKTYALFRGLCKDVPNWSDFIENFDYNYNRDKDKNKNNPDHRYITDKIVVYNKFDPIIFGAIKDKTTRLFYKSLKASIPIEGLIKKKASSIKSIMNFLGNEQEYWIHSDDHDVISWHCVGTVEWRFYKNLKEEDMDKISIEGAEYDSVLLEPGDVVYVPAGVVHQIINNKPRASLIFQYFQDPDAIGNPY